LKISKEYKQKYKTTLEEELKNNFNQDISKIALKVLTIDS
jgi:hypothetical protein